MKKVLMAVALGGLLCTPPARAADACCPIPVMKNSKVILKAIPTADLSAVTLKVTGMTCEACARGVQSALTKVAGVNAAQVSLDQGQAVVSYEAKTANTAQLIAAVTKTGTFKATLMTPPTTKAQQIYCEGKSAGQLCGEGTVAALKLSGAKKAAWAEAANRYNTAVEAATRRLLKDTETTLSPQDLAIVKQWFARGVNTQINQQLAKAATQ